MDDLLLKIAKMVCIVTFMAIANLCVNEKSEMMPAQSMTEVESVAPVFSNVELTPVEVDQDVFVNWMTPEITACARKVNLVVF